MGNNQPPRRDVNAAQRAALALQLRGKRLTYERIAQMVGFANASAARKAIQRELDRIVVHNVEQLRAEEAATLDAMQSQVYDLMIDRANKGRLFAVDRMLAIMDHRAKLFGLYQSPSEPGASASAQVIIREAPPGYFGKLEPPKIEEAKG